MANKKTVKAPKTTNSAKQDKNTVRFTDPNVFKFVEASKKELKKKN